MEHRLIQGMHKYFRRSEEGSLSVETIFAIPMLVWAITATFVFWDAFKTLNVSQKATYTVADMLSRETQTIDADYLTGMQGQQMLISQGFHIPASRAVDVSDDPIIAGFMRQGMTAIPLPSTIDSRAVWSTGAEAYVGVLRDGLSGEEAADLYNLQIGQIVGLVRRLIGMNPG